jgi:hypothetical protein
MFDLQVLAFMTEVTRVSAFKMGRDVSARVWPESGVKTPFHTLSHHQNKPDKLAEFAKLNEFHVNHVAYFLSKLKSTPDGDGTSRSLDGALRKPHGRRQRAQHLRVPLFLAGHANGELKGNWHLLCPDGTPWRTCSSRSCTSSGSTSIASGTARERSRFREEGHDDESSPDLSLLVVRLAVVDIRLAEQARRETSRSALAAEPEVT